MANQNVSLPSGYSSELADVRRKGLFDGIKFNTNSNFRRNYIKIPNRCSKVLLRSSEINGLTQWMCIDTFEKDVNQYVELGKINDGKIGETTFDIQSGYKYLMVQFSPSTGIDIYVEFIK